MKPEKCKGCPLYGELGPVWGEGPKVSPLIILGQSLGPTEVAENRPFVGTSGQLLNRVLGKVGISRASSYVTNTVKCFVKPGSPVPPDAIRHCSRAFLDDEIREIKPKVVLTLGQEAFDNLCAPKHLSIVHNRQAAKKDPSYWLVGAPYHHKLGFVVVPNVHPAFVARTGFALEPKFARIVQTTLDVMYQGAPLPKDITFNYNPTDQEVREYVPYLLSQPAGGCDIETPYNAIEEDEANPDNEDTKVSLIGLAATPREVIGVSPDQFHILTDLFHPSTPRRDPFRLWCYGSQTEWHFLGKLYEGNPGVRWADAMFAYHLLWSDERSKDLGTAGAMYTRWGYWKNLEHREPILYNCLDTVGCLEIGERALEEMVQFPIDMRPIFWDLMDCVPVILPWKHVGANYDQHASDVFQLKIAKVLRQYETFWRTKFPLTDWSSPKQLVQFFTALGIKVPLKKRPKGKSTPCVDEEALEGFAKKGSAVAKLIILMRQLRKSDDFCNLATGSPPRFRTRARIHGQAGHRIQCVDKNVQQIPEEMLVDPKVDGSGIFPRETILPEHPEDAIIAADFSQIEFWLYAYLSGCQKLLDVKERGEYLYGDFYESIWAGDHFFLPGVPRTKGNRDDAHTPPWKLLVAKSWPLGFIYGRGVPGVEGLPITPARAKQIRNDFHAAYPEIGRYHNKIMFDATRQGYLQTCFGHMRRFANPQAQRNQLLAFPGQTTAAGILIKKVVLGAGREVARLFGERSRLYFTVHDSGIFNIQGAARDLGIATRAVQYIKGVMESPIAELDGFSIPAEVKIGPNWGQTKSLEKYLATIPATAVRDF